MDSSTKESQNNRVFEIFEKALKSPVKTKALSYKDAVKLRKTLYNEKKTILNNAPELLATWNHEILLEPVFPEGFADTLSVKDLPHKVVIQRKNLYVLSSFSDLFED